MGMSNLYEQVKKFFYSLTKYDYDQAIIIKFLGKYAPNNQSNYRVLDVGCGYGKKMLGLMAAGYNVLGVDVNPEIIKANQKQGLKCVTVEEFADNEDKFDCILMSHIIEHFYPSDLKDWLDDYLDRLKPSGYLIIATPLLNEYFYDDFDHIKPYSPMSIIMVFGKKATQVQYYSKNKLAFKDVQFRKRHYLFTLVRGKYIRGWDTKLYQMLEFISALLCRMSFGYLGRKDGWVGIFKKI